MNAPRLALSLLVAAFGSMVPASAVGALEGAISATAAVAPVANTPTNVLPLPRLQPGDVAFERAGSVTLSTEGTPRTSLSPGNENATATNANPNPNAPAPAAIDGPLNPLVLQGVLIGQGLNPLGVANPMLKPFAFRPAGIKAPEKPFLGGPIAPPIGAQPGCLVPGPLGGGNPFAPFGASNPFSTVASTNWNQLVLRPDGIYYPVPGSGRSDARGNAIPGTATYYNPLTGNTFQNGPAAVPPIPPAPTRAATVTGVKKR